MIARVSGINLRLFPPSLEPWKGEGTGRAVAVLMSGGVDSSVVALLLQQAGWKVLGITMKLPVAEGCGHAVPCCGAEAALVCHALGVPHYFLDAEGAFRALVVEPFCRLYLQGHTPSPCVDCNTLLKFGLVWDLVEANFGVSHLATGHYAQVVEVGGRSRLARAADLAKDQSYFLYGVARERLGSLLLPLGALTKAEVRRRARAAGLAVAERPESMELCFAGEGDYRRALPADAATSPGPILNGAGAIIGRHDGIAHFTLGQRHGLRVAVGKPLYVTRILPAENAIVVGTREEASRREVWAAEINALAPELLRVGRRLWGKIRSHGEPEACTVAAVSAAGVAVVFDSPQFAPAPGQRLVLYDEHGTVVAGGTIGEGAGVPSLCNQECVA